MASQSEFIRVVQQLSFCRDMDCVISVLGEAARSLTGADGVTVVLRDGDLCHYAEENAITPLWKGLRFPMEACISGWCMLHREQVAIKDIYADMRIPHEAYKPTFVKSLAMTPIRSADPLGAIGAYWSNHHQATPDELNVLQGLGDAAAIAVANIELFDSLQQASRRKDEFLFMLAHELRSPLAPIFNALQVLRVGGNGKAQEQQERAFELLERQARHLAHIVDELLDGARIARGKMNVQHERLDLAQLARHSVEDRRGVLEAAGLHIEFVAPDTPLWVSGDATRLAQVLANVLDNAGKFTPAGGTIKVELLLDKQAQQIVVSIQDSGIGLDQDILPYVFEVFSQADHTLDRARGGLGMGLFVAKGILDLHQGSIEATSAGTGQGATFTIRLPFAMELPALTAGTVSTDPVVKPLHILVVEDNRDSAESLRMLLEICGYRVTLAHTGPEGLEMAKSKRPDVVLCDIGLPGLDGFAVAIALREDPNTAGTRLIAVTGYGQDADRRRALEAGFDAHLVKPVEPDRLLKHLAQPPRASQ